MLIWTTILSLFFFGHSRFRQPVEPYLIILAALGGTHLFSIFKKKSHSVLVVMSIIVFHLFVFFRLESVISYIRRVF